VNLFGRARKALGGGVSAESAAPQAYRVVCPEGHILSGQRTEGYQALRCPACGEGVFVLPRSPLPLPPAPVAQRARRRRAVQPVAEGPIELMDAPAEVELAQPQVEVEIQWEEDEQPARPAPAPAPAEETPKADRPAPRKASAAARAAPSRPAGRAARSTRPTAPPPEPPPRRVIEMPTRTSLRERLYRRRHGLALLAVMLLVAGTIGVRLLRQRLEDLPKIAAANQEEGTRALIDGSFDVARRKLDIAASALERLGDSEAANVRHMADEAALLADLTGETLEEILEDVATRSDGPEQFRTLYRGRSIIMDAHIESPGELDYRIFGSGNRRARISLDGFALLADKRPGDAVTFGARLSSMSLGDDNVWQIGLEPDSGVFISTPAAWKALETLGWPPHIAPVEGAAAGPESDGEPRP
jgi:hypothetical protein